MQATELDWRLAPDSASSATHLNADEIARLAAMMRELRDLTQSRRTFADATRFLQQYGDERISPFLVDGLQIWSQ